MYDCAQGSYVTTNVTGRVYSHGYNRDYTYPGVGFTLHCMYCSRVRIPGFLRKGIIYILVHTEFDIPHLSGKRSRTGDVYHQK